MSVPRLWLIVAACSLVVSAWAADPGPATPAQPAPEASRVPDTLMFSIDELTEVQSRAAATTQEKETGKDRSGEIEKATLYLSTILYYGPKSWTIWINGVPISPGQEFQSFQITDIKPDYVELTVPLSALGMRPVKLSPNQTLIVASGTVVEGPWQ